MSRCLFFNWEPSNTAHSAVPTLPQCGKEEKLELMMNMLIHNVPLRDVRDCLKKRIVAYRVQSDLFLCIDYMK